MGLIKSKLHVVVERNAAGGGLLPIAMGERRQTTYINTIKKQEAVSHVLSIDELDDLS
jgi:hypothetical protein